MGCEGKFGWCSVNKLAMKAMWATGQPDNFGGKENCLGLNMTKVKVQLQDEDCLKQFPFICEVIHVKRFNSQNIYCKASFSCN